MKKLITSFTLILALKSFGWGLTGHRIIGHIAMEHLNPEVKKHILQTLNGEDLAMVSNWMDFIKSESTYDSLKPYHYCTIVDVEAIKTHEHPKQGDVWLAINTFLSEVKNDEYSVDEGFALRALSHLIGDVHQPLHCGNGSDMGGNQVKVIFFWENSNLHQVWDSGMIDYWKMSYTEYAKWIMSTISHEEVNEWKKSTTEDWVRESVLSREQCYETMGNPETMGYRYVYENKDLLHQRLAQAGVRLAAALNKAYATRVH